MLAPFVTESAAYTVWGISLGIGLAVTVVVAVLLALIARTAEQIEDEVENIWTAGQRIASNTVHIPLLQRTNLAVARVLDHAAGIDQAVAAIEQHAEGCPGCPLCVRGGRR